MRSKASSLTAFKSIQGVVLNDKSCHVFRETIFGESEERCVVVMSVCGGQKRNDYSSMKISKPVTITTITKHGIQTDPPHMKGWIYP